MHILGGDNTEIGCFIDDLTVAYLKDGHDSADSAPAAVAPPASSYWASVEQWSNCRVSDPLQVTGYRMYVTHGHVLTTAISFDSAINFTAGTLFVNATNFVRGTHRSHADQDVFGLRLWTVQNAVLPWAAGSKAVPIAASFNIAGVPSMTRVATLHFYDEHMAEVGCFQYTATLMAPHSANSASSADESPDHPAHPISGLLHSMQQHEL